MADNLNQNGQQGNDVDKEEKEVEIESICLYRSVQRIYNELAELGYDRECALKVEDVNKFDNYHYYGTQAIQEAINRLGICSSHRVLDVGSGLGGPARFIAKTTGCHVTAIELQPEVHHTARLLTKRCGLEKQVTHLNGNILENIPGEYDFVVSWLVFLHIADKATVFSNCFNSLKPGGKLFIEDFFEKGKLSTEEIDDLLTGVFVNDCPDKINYIDTLTAAGFKSIQWEDVTSSFAKFVAERVVRYTANKDRHVRVHGETIYLEQLSFFTVVNKLFQAGNLGGCKVMASKPMT